MSQLKGFSRNARQKRVSVTLSLFVALFVSGASGCRLIPGVKSKVTVPQLLAPQQVADTNQLIAEINKLAAVQSLRGKVDIQFLDTSFARCGIAEKYRTADGTFILQRPGKVNLAIQIPFVGSDIAKMTSDGEQFRVAVLQGEERFRRFVRGTNNAVYQRLEMNMDDGDCGDDNKRERAATQQRAVGALSGLRPQHFTDALLIRPVAQDANTIYTRSEFFQEEADNRTAAERKKNGNGNKGNSGNRIVRSYYLLDELVPFNGSLNNASQARIARRFWFDRYQGIRLARLQTFDEQGQLLTDVLYKEPRTFGGNNLARQTENGEDALTNNALTNSLSNNTTTNNTTTNLAPFSIVLPSRIEVTRPQDRYSISITYQAPESVILNRPYNDNVFLLANEWSLPEVDLDKNRSQEPEVRSQK